MIQTRVRLNSQFWWLNYYQTFKEFELDLISDSSCAAFDETATGKKNPSNDGLMAKFARDV